MEYTAIGQEKAVEKPSFYTFDDLIELCKKYPTKIFRFIDTNYSPGEITSWRGFYCVPAITYSDTPTIGSLLIDTLKEDLLKTHTGYKGGECHYNAFMEFYVSAWGLAEEYKVKGYEVNKTEVILITDIDPY